MSYTALYRTFRPKTFSEVVGQDHIKTTLKNQIKAGRVGHAYLLNGTRGTGKTTIAKILSRVINCENPQDGEPCNECEICKAILDGSLTDVVEMDAASNNSVEDIREIRNEVNFLPTRAKYRVYIIDEVHMLSTGAFNALLKTLEEPPEHVKFILATTEPQKLPATILSRCQRFDFKKITTEDIITRLEFICSKNNVKITKDSLKLIAVLSEGAMRDALSILERCIQEGNSDINEDRVRDLVGIPKLISVHNILKSIIENDVERAIEEIEIVKKEGKDLINLLWEMIKYSKDILVTKIGKKIEIYNQEEIKKMNEVAKEVTKEKLLMIIYKLSEIENNLKQSSQKTILFEAGIINLCNNTETLEERLKKLEDIIIENKINIPKEDKKKVNIIQNISEEKKEINKSENIEEKLKPKVEKVNNLKSQEFWHNILNKLKENGKLMLYANLLNTRAVEINDMTIGIEFPGNLNEFRKNLLEKSENINEIQKLVSIEYGKEMQIKYLNKSEDKKSNKDVNKNKKTEEKKQDNNINSINDLAGLGLPVDYVDE